MRCIWLLALVSGTVAVGCEEDSVDLVAECVPQGPPVRLPLPGDEYLRGFGVLGDRIFVSSGASPDEEYADTFARYARWFDADGRPMGEPEFLGTSVGAPRSDLALHEGALIGQYSIDPEGARPAPAAHEVVGLWSFRPGRAPERQPVSLPVEGRACLFCPYDIIGVGGWMFAGPQGAAPITNAGVAALSGIPEPCDGGYDVGRWRLLAFDAARARAVRWDEEPCSDDPWVNTEEAVSSAQVVGLPAGHTGVLFRRGAGVGRGHVHYVRLDENLELVSGPRRVGGTWEHPTGVNEGYQPKGALAGTRVLFNERGPGSYNSCQVLRSVTFDGGGGERTPWQLPCVDAPGDLYTRSSDLIELPDDLAVVVWGERSWGFSAIDPAVYQEGIYLSVLTPQGKRGSEVVEVTAPESTASEQRASGRRYPADYLVYLAADGPTVAVGWEDRRGDAPGFYVRRFTCGRFEE